MNCEKIREELELGFGTDATSDEIAEHLRSCETCRVYREELAHLAPGLGDDEDIILAPAAIERAVRDVERRITPHRPSRTPAPGWMRPLIRLAAAAAVLLFAFGAYELGRMQSASMESQAILPAALDDASMASVLQDDINIDMDDAMVSVLISEYSSGANLGATEALIGDISEEEMEYLEKNFEAGDLL